MIKLLIFDFDGTISDARDIAFQSFTRVLDEYGYKFNRKRAFKLLGTKMHIMLKELGVNEGHLRSIRRRFYRYFKRGAVEGGIKLCVPVEPLWELRKKYPLIIVSNSETAFLKASIKRLGIRGLFGKIYGAEKFGSKDEMLEKIFRKRKVKPSEAIYVGDRFSDIEFARKAGCVAIAIHNKCAFSDLKTIKKEKPDYIVRDFGELKRVVGKIK